MDPYWSLEAESLLGIEHFKDFKRLVYEALFDKVQGMVQKLSNTDVGGSKNCGHEVTKLENCRNF